MPKEEPRLPEVADDGTWLVDLAGEQFRMREAKLRERDQALDEAMRERPAAPDLYMNSRLLSMVTERRGKDGAYEPLTFGEIMERGESFYQTLQAQYLLGLAAKVQRTKKSSANSKKAETSQGQPEALIRP